MKRLLKVSFDLALLSLIPVLSWFALSLIIDKNLINVFTLTYPIQFIWYIFKSIFSTSPNISQEKNNNKNVVMSGIVIGSIVAFFVFGIIALNIDGYINFMNMDISTYKTFAIYSVIHLYIQLIFNFYIGKLYYEEKNTLANKYSLIFNSINFIVLVITSLIFKNQIVIIVLTLLAVSIYTLIIVIRESDKFKMEFRLFKDIKYDSVELFNNIAFFFIFLFGLSNALEYGESYLIAITFVSLITDTQWDVYEAIAVVSEIDISKNRFNYKEHRNNAYKLLGLLILSVIIMLVVLYNSYNLNIYITSIFISFELINFIIYPIYKIKTCFLQLEYSAIKTTLNDMIASGERLALSLLKTPYCTGIGQVASSIYKFISINIIFHKNYKIDSEGYVQKKLINTNNSN